MKFTKMQGAGNDFVLVEAGNVRKDWTKTAVAACDRHYGIGADGLLLLLPSKVADFGMRIFNADGSESDVCGNGLRCMVKYFTDKQTVDAGTRQILVETRAGVRKAEVHQAAGKANGIKIGMGKPRFRAEEIPVLLETERDKIVDIKSMITCSLTVVNRELRLSLVSMGNPHAVHFYQRPVSDFPLSRVGSEVERHEAFPKRTNFEVVRVLNQKQVEARVWERGVGETLACGSGACAIAVAARLHGFIDNEVEIKLPGGVLTASWDGVGEIFLGGPAAVVFSGEWQN